MDDRCLFCGEPATHLCDHVLGVDIQEAMRLGVEAGRDTPIMCPDRTEIFRCDAPMCHDHRAVVGWMGHRGRGGWSDTIDLCHHHASAGLARATGRGRFITRDEAEEMRARMRHIYQVGASFHVGEQQPALPGLGHPDGG